MAFLLFIALALSSAAATTVTLSVGDVFQNVSDRYLCFNIDTGSLFNGMNFSDSKFRTLVSQLAPSIIRIGGTAVDSSFYFPDAPYLVGQPNPCDACGSGAAAIGHAMIHTVFDFITATGMSLLWDVNGRSARPTPLGPWDPAANFTPMAAYINATWGGRIDFAYSVGNEPDLWASKVTATQLAHDAVAMKQALAAFSIGNGVFGSSWARISPQDAMDFLPIAGAGGVNGLTVHNYPYGGHDCNITKYLNKSAVSEKLTASLRAVADVAASIPAAKDVLLVLEETAGSSGGGCENVTDRFLASFVWMNTLNAVAVGCVVGRACTLARARNPPSHTLPHSYYTLCSGFGRVHRQDIAGWSFAFGQSHYMLVGPAGWTNGTHDTLTPHPDYFLTILWKQLVGRSLLHTQAAGSKSALQAVEAHAWCSSARAPYGAGTPVLAWTNQGADAVQLQVPAALARAKAT